MTTYLFQKAARPELLDQLLAAGLPGATAEFDGHPAAAGAWTGGTACWVTCDPAQFDAAATVVAAHDVAALNAQATQAAADDTTNRQAARAALAALADDVTALTGAGTLTVAQLRAMLARTDQALIALVKFLARRGL